MPYKSDAQRRYFNANRSKLEDQGVDVNEWNESSKGKKLPEKVKEKEGFDALTSLKDNAAAAMQKLNQLNSFKTNAVKTFQNAKNVIQSIPRKAYEFGGMRQGANVGGRIAPDMVLGGLLGGGLGLLSDPGEDEQGRKRSRLARALGLGLGGAAIGGTSAYFAPEISQFGRNVGSHLGSLAGGLKYDLSKLGFDSAPDLKPAIDAAEAYRNASRAINFGAATGSGVSGGALAGAGLGLFQDPGYDKQTGKKRSRLWNALGMGLGGAAIGGAGLGSLSLLANHLRKQSNDSGLSKQALHVGEGGVLERLAASTVGRINPYSLINLIMSERSYSDPSRDLLFRKDPNKIKRHEETAKLFDKYDPQALNNTILRLGGTDILDDIIYKKIRDKKLPWYSRIGGRVWHNPKTSILGKTLGTMAAPFNLFNNLRRSSHYNPVSDAATIYANDDAIVEHELGHALDINKLYGIRPDKSKGILGAIAQQAKGLARDAYLQAYTRIPGFSLLPEAQANIQSQLALNHSLKNDPEELARRNSRRLAVLPAGYATYIAGSIPGLRDSILPALGIGKGLGLISSTIYRNALAPKEKKHETTQVQNSSKPILKAANFMNALGVSLGGFTLGAVGFEPAPLISRRFNKQSNDHHKQARCWEGYEPVPGKKPYSEDSCRPAGSGKKKKEKKADCGCGGPKDACTCGSCGSNNKTDVSKLAKLAVKKAWSVEGDGGIYDSRSLANAELYGPAPKIPSKHPNPDREYVAQVINQALAKMPKNMQLHWVDNDNKPYSLSHQSDLAARNAVFDRIHAGEQDRDNRLIAFDPTLTDEATIAANNAAIRESSRWRKPPQRAWYNPMRYIAGKNIKSPHDYPNHTNNDYIHLNPNDPKNKNYIHDELGYVEKMMDLYEDLEKNKTQDNLRNYLNHYTQPIIDENVTNRLPEDNFYPELLEQDLPWTEQQLKSKDFNNNLSNVYNSLATKFNNNNDRLAAIDSVIKNYFPHVPAQKLKKTAANLNPTSPDAKSPGNAFAGGLGCGLTGSAIGNNHGQAAGTNAAAVPGDNKMKKAYVLGRGLGNLSLRTTEKQADWSSYIPAIAALGVGGLAGYGLGHSGGFDSGHSAGYDQGYDQGTHVSEKDSLKALMRGLHQVMQQGRNSTVPMSDLVGHDDDYPSRLELNRANDRDETGDDLADMHQWVNQTKRIR